MGQMRACSVALVYHSNTVCREHWVRHLTFWSVPFFSHKFDGRLLHNITPWSESSTRTEIIPVSTHLTRMAVFPFPQFPVPVDLIPIAIVSTVCYHKTQKNLCFTFNWQQNPPSRSCMWYLWMHSSDRIQWFSNLKCRSTSTCQCCTITPTNLLYCCPNKYWQCRVHNFTCTEWQSTVIHQSIWRCQT